MNRSKKIFLTLIVIFFLLLGYASYDMSRKTTFPGSKPQLKERLKKNIYNQDTLNNDTIKA